MEEDKKPEGKRYRTMESIAGVFAGSDVRQKLFGNKGFQFYLFQKRWPKIVGDLMAEESYITGCKGPKRCISTSLEGSSPYRITPCRTMS